MNGAHAFLEVLSQLGIKQIFGNPGTTELPLIDALAGQQQVRYILGLHEVPVVAMADGFAQASGQPSVVNLHTACGLGNAMGMLFNCLRSGTPVVATAGQQDTRLQFREPALWTDLVRLAASCTKWSQEVAHADDLPQAISRAVNIALSPPAGPVFLALPVDVMSNELESEVGSTQPPIYSDVRPSPAGIRKAAALLAASENPAILAGSRVADRNAIAAVEVLADLLGAPVMSEPRTARGRLGFSTTHALAAEGLPLWAPDIRKRLEPFDVVLAIGVDLFRLYVYFRPDDPIPTDTKLIHMDCNAGEVGKNYRTDVGIVGDLASGAEELKNEISVVLPDQAKSRAAERRGRWETVHRRQRDEMRRKARLEREAQTVTPLALMQTLAEILPKDAAIVDEAATAEVTALPAFGGLAHAQRYFGHRGWALGWGLGAAIGVKLAWPGRCVAAILGDGALQYGLQGLWTAAHYNIPIKIFVPNNFGYGILKHTAQVMQLPNAQRGQFEAMDLDSPEIDIPALARAYGVESLRIQDLDDLKLRCSNLLTSDGPCLIEVPMSR